MMAAARLREVLDYDPVAGIFWWRLSRGRVKAGDAAGCMHEDGYRRIQVDGRLYKASRLAWLYTHGYWPKAQIDHKNADKADDRLTNLRDVTNSGNLQNQRLSHSDNKTGLLGVRPHGAKFQALIMVDGKVRCLGTFPTPAEAHAVYLVAKRELHSTCTI